MLTPSKRARAKIGGAWLRRRRVELTCCNALDWPRQKRPVRRQQFLKAFVRPARARIIAAELFDQLLVAVHDAQAALDVRLGREAAPAFTHPLESRAGRDTDLPNDPVRVAWDTSW